MASLETRLLVLGAVAIFEPVNGYRIMRELQTWNIEEWAHIRPGSVYSVLRTLVGQGHLERHDLVDRGREVAVYTTTAEGRAERDVLFARAVREVRLLDPVPFHTALAVLPLFDRPSVIEHLRARQAALDDFRSEFARNRAAYDWDVAPPHVGRMLDLQDALLAAEREQVAALLDDVVAGHLDLAGEPPSWRPRADDPGWEMNADRQRYRALLDQRR